MRRTLLAAALLVPAVVAGWLAYAQFDRRQTQNAIATARADIEAARFASARRKLDDLLRSHPSESEAWFLQGQCERATGRLDAAVEAWRHVDAGSLSGPRAALLSADHLIERGEYAELHDRLAKAIGFSTSNLQKYDLMKQYARVCRFEGLTCEVRRNVRQALLISPDPAADLKELWMLDNSPMPVEAWGDALAKAPAADAGALLGRVQLATRLGRLDEAQSSLTRARAVFEPSHPSFARSAFDLALARGDFDGLSATLQNDPKRWLDRDEAETARAVLLDRFGEESEATQALEGLVGRSPQQSWALDRLAERAARRGDVEAARQLQAKKSHLDTAKDRFRELILDGPTPHSFAELGRLAAELQRPLEAAAWNTLAESGTNDWPGAAQRAGLASLAVDIPSAADIDLLTQTVTQGRRALPDGPDRPASVTPPVFTDKAQHAGLRFTFDQGATSRHLLPETMSGGIGLLDYDGDGWLDVYVVQGGSLVDLPGGERESDRLFRNTGDGSLEDETERAGITALPRGYGLGVAVGDYDNDGRPDLFISRLSSYALLHNRGDGTFDDVTTSSGLAGRRENPSSAAFADLDADGDLDLYVCHYMKFDPENPVVCYDDKGRLMYCDPSKVESSHDALFRNDNGTFVDITKEAGIVDPNGRGLGVVAADFDDDGRVDIYVANDGTANYLFRNLGGMRFEDVAPSVGAAGNAEGGYQASMGVACGDLDGDGRLDLVVTNFWGECSTLYHNMGGGLFSDWTAASGLAQATRYLLGFGTAFFDYDNDGRLDLVTANGHVNDNRPLTPYAMRPQLLANVEGGRLVDAGLKTGGVWSREVLGRGLAIGDVDNDGRADVLILPQGEPVMYLHNETNGGRFLALRLIGTTSNRDAVGARVKVKAGGHVQVFERFGGGSYQSASDGRFLIGVADAPRAEVEVRWPTGEVERFQDLETNRGHALTEGRGRPEPLAAYAK